MTTAAMQNLWAYIQGLNLSQRNEAWLEGKLAQSRQRKQQAKSAADADPTLMTREEFFARVDEARKGTGKSFSCVKELDHFIRSL